MAAGAKNVSTHTSWSNLYLRSAGPELLLLLSMVKSPCYDPTTQMPERKLLDQVSDVARLRHLSLRIEETRPRLEAIIITVMVLEMKVPHGKIWLRCVR